MVSNSLKDYLKRYESNPEEDKKKKKKTIPQATGLLVVDEDPAWQKPIDLGYGEKPIVDEVIEVNRCDLEDLSPPRRGRHDSPSQDTLHGSVSSTRSSLSDVCHHRSPIPSVKVVSHPYLDRDLSPPRKSPKESSIPTSVQERKAGLISSKDIREEIDRKKKDDMLRLKQMDPSISGRGAEPVFRDSKGLHITKEEYLKSKQKVVKKAKEIEIEFGKGLTQKRKAEARQKELEDEKDKPFARTRDDPELNKFLKEKVRSGDPMEHLVKKKYPQTVLPNMGESDLKYLVPQDIPDQSWLKRGIEAPPNRYGIRPGRHWDGVDRSNGFFLKEIAVMELMKRANERQAKEKEAYLWSVSDM